MRSYRDLPLRFAETGTVYRYERSGVLQGLFRVRGFTQDDAHIFCQPEKIEEEILGVIEFTLSILKNFGFDQFEIFLATRPEKYVGPPEDWDRATEALRRALDSKGLPYNMDEGGGAFYGPKIDVKIRDAIGRSWQCSTVQFDFNLPERFDISYIAEDGKARLRILVDKFHKSEDRPQAMLMIGQIDLGAKRWRDARQSLEDLLKEHQEAKTRLAVRIMIIKPGSSAARMFTEFDQT